GALSVTATFLGTFLDVLILTLLFAPSTTHMLFARHGLTSSFSLHVECQTILLPQRAQEAFFSSRLRAALLALANRKSISRLKAGISLGLRLVTQFRSTTTSESTQSPPALRTSSLIV